MNYWENANHAWTKDSKRVINTPSNKTKSLFNYIQEIGHFKAYQPYYTERANLPSYLMKLTLSGTGHLNYKGQDYILDQGDIFFIDCQHYQHYKTISDIPWEMDWIHVYGGITSQLYEEYNKDGNPVFHTNALPEENTIHHLVQTLIKDQSKANARTDFHSSVKIHELLNELIIQKYHLDFSIDDIPQYILELKEYLDSHFHNVITLNDLEHLFHLNKYQINKDFSKYIGLPPIDYLITKKVSHAKDLLRYTDLSIQEISLNIGIDNFAYFSRLFKNKTGMTPSFFRKEG
ncbi:AraC family transcriptional regulator [Erysipelothrix larvae]|uniref:AraC family transcriptional regulator n=1 Tax=Erysipelothrix larvae TaxID=1514105 RepID=A0A0X8H1W4_9FIRM|nr:AraC family transcriptional regulator [Erysipelothrix larvae]AMC94505.1 AraC family transcriptional regulator [Erysipelothrix larvae]